MDAYIINDRDSAFDPFQLVAGDIVTHATYPEAGNLTVVSVKPMEYSYTKERHVQKVLTAPPIEDSVHYKLWKVGPPPPLDMRMSGKRVMLFTALSYAQRGWRLTPMANPMGSRLVYIRRYKGNRDYEIRPYETRDHALSLIASNSKMAIYRWSDELWPDANIGIRVGQESNLAVLRVPVSLSERLKEDAFRFGVLPETLTAITDVGEDFYFTTQIAASTDRENQLSKWHTIDGGVALAPPSFQLSGKRISWKNPLCSIAPLPRWIYANISWLVDVSAPAQRHLGVSSGKRRRPRRRLSCRHRAYLHSPRRPSCRSNSSLRS